MAVAASAASLTCRRKQMSKPIALTGETEDNIKKSYLQAGIVQSCKEDVSVDRKMGLQKVNDARSHLAMINNNKLTIDSLTVFEEKQLLLEDQQRRFSQCLML